MQILGLVLQQTSGVKYGAYVGLSSEMANQNEVPSIIEAIAVPSHERDVLIVPAADCSGLFQPVPCSATRAIRLGWR